MLNQISFGEMRKMYGQTDRKTYICQYVRSENFKASFQQYSLI